MSLAAYTDRHVRALAEQGTPAEKAAAHAELVKRGLTYTPAQHAENRKRVPRHRGRDDSRSWGWGGRE